MKNLMLFVLSRPIFNGLILGTTLGIWRFLNGKLNSGNFDKCVTFSFLVAVIFIVLVFLFRKKYVTAPRWLLETLIKVGPDNKVIDVVDAKRRNFFKKAIWGSEKTGKFYRFSEQFDMDAKVGEYDWDNSPPKNRDFTWERKIVEHQSGLTVPLKIKFYFKEFFEMKDWQTVVDKIIVPAAKFPDKSCTFVAFFSEQLLPIKKDLYAANYEQIKKFRENKISFYTLNRNICDAFYDKLTEHMILPFISGIRVEIGTPTYDNKSEF